MLGKEVSESQQVAMLGVSLNCTAGTTVQEVVGWQMEGAFGDPDAADEIWRWRTDSTQYEMVYLFDSSGSIPTFDGQWFDQITAMPSTMDLTSGKGFWTRNKGSAVNTIDFDGLVQRAMGQVPVVVDASVTKLHQMGQPMAADVALSETETSYLSDGALGSMVAHYFRESTGEGQHVDVSIQQACMLTLMNAPEYWDVMNINIPRLGSALPFPRKGMFPLIMPAILPCKDGHVTFFLPLGSSRVMLKSN